ncbi:MAG: NADAR family protein [Candidatus Absconditabacteria bacterium]|nr:NADAR family protein [Candidatus Absconditabacteria bacterium]MDD3868238.1 NADAR family protein [Candidatus Absconditabacteria bacterium]MDD4714634.1 NADAR family protein [Candidatus Absconditabacteria bacterium]
MNTSDLFDPSRYSKKEITDAALIVHPSSTKYNLKQEEIAQIFEVGSNFTHLDVPIVDEYGNEYWDSEGYYMAKRTENLNEKKMIAFLSIGYGCSRKARDLFDLEQDEEKRISYMREAIKLKFDSNPRLREELFTTKGRDIIEYTYWGDVFFGIEQTTLQGRNILGKLLVEYRDAYLRDNENRE